MINISYHLCLKDLKLTTPKSSILMSNPDIADKVSTIHQGIRTCPSESFGFRDYLRTTYSYTAQSKILLLVAGIRPVKDPLFLLEEFANSELANTMSFVVIGPLADEDYRDKFFAGIQKLRQQNVIYAGEMSMEDVHTAIQQSDCLVNSSTSEGMCAAILEAFDLQTPVIARENAGNCYLVKHEVTGMLYKTAQEYVQCVKKLMNSHDLKLKFSSNAKNHLMQSFSPEKERELYGQLLKQLE
ncbi:GLT1D1 [Bugula neritina]|uniref:GLT1D1 n=1 Tax=Bugula neritina TaxID=10212 RepID=A0A7J7J8G8_BUGNE|nr:GLT1D1 [Bugula neritina]